MGSTKPMTTCLCGKRRYRSKRAARQRLALWRRADPRVAEDGAIAPYKCPTASRFWHLGHPRPWDLDASREEKRERIMRRVSGGLV